eukprot:TRINITY_DN105077_c0_g1_i1.p1 TRINITY_DN105077_c0_g1~~TRINITY_DN105077_c0_g1_i1.p1  ORF type:complete len:644 (+),score=122.80 TRINITY_DN105077_c0_g1_i1:341-2272(+)
MSSGAMPPNSESGKRFIHDPKIEGIAETKASIKLSFASTEQREVCLELLKFQQILAMRTYRVTNKGGKKAEFRKLDQILKYRDIEGKERSINNSCIDMDKQMSKLFGVSSAVLENVIFCHQEETLWPFSDQAHLKKIFDEIFETEKYTKVLQDMRQEAKNYRSHKKMIKGEFDLKSKDFQIYKKIVKTVEECKEKVVRLEEDAKKIESDISAETQKLEAFADKEAKLKELDGELQVLKFQASELKAQFNKLSTNPQYKDLGKSREELQEMLRTLEETRAKVEAEKKAVEDAHQNAAAELSKVEGELVELRTKKSAVEEILNQEKRLVTNIKIRAKMQNEQWERLNKEPIFGEIQLVSQNSTENIKNAIAQLQEKLAEKKVVLDEREKEIQEKLNQATVGIKLKIVLCFYNSQNVQEESRELRKKLDQKKIELESAKKTNAEKLREDMKRVDANLEDLHKKLEKYGGNTEQQAKYFENYDKQIQEAENERTKIQSELEEYNAKRAAVFFCDKKHKQNQESINAKITMTKQLLSNTETQLRTTLERLRREMRKKGLKDELSGTHLFGIFDSQIKQIREKVDSQQKQLKESRSNADVAKCNSGNLLKSIQSESKHVLLNKNRGEVKESGSRTQWIIGRLQIRKEGV